MSETIAVIGAGLIGRSWGIVFARGGYNVRLYDHSAGALSDASSWLEQVLRNLEDRQLISNFSEVHSKIHFASSMQEALEGAVYVQESASEELRTKIDLYTRLDAHLPPTIPVGSSTSALLPSEFSVDVRHKERCLVAHPVNPPHVIPFVELVPSKWTSSTALSFARNLMQEVGQVPIVLSTEIPGFVLNRLQAALVNEAMALVRDQIASPDDIDKALSDGLGLRWAFMGPFQTMDLNASGGFADYAAKFRQVYEGTAREAAISWSPEAIRQVSEARRASLPVARIPEQQIWRDRRIEDLLAIKAAAHEKRGDGK